MGTFHQLCSLAKAQCHPYSRGDERGLGETGVLLGDFVFPESLGFTRVSSTWKADSGSPGAVGNAGGSWRIPNSTGSSAWPWSSFPSAEVVSSQYVSGVILTLFHLPPPLVLNRGPLSEKRLIFHKGKCHSLYSFSQVGWLSWLPRSVQTHTRTHPGQFQDFFLSCLSLVGGLSASPVLRAFGGNEIPVLWHHNDCLAVTCLVVKTLKKTLFPSFCSL